MIIKVHNVLHNVRRLFSSPSKGCPNICIIGAGPAGFYAAMHLANHLPTVKIDIYDKLPTPFGLIRYGVAPDHPDVKNVINQFNKVALKPNVNFYGNVALGRDLNLFQFRQCYDAVLLTYGAEKDKFLEIENEDAKNVIAAREFVGWYNGFPSDKHLKIDLSAETAVILGQGNVALDVARILLTPIDNLRKTDITEHALSNLAHSKVKEVYLVGRRGPLQVAFTIKELREFLKLPHCKTIWRKQDFIGVDAFVDDLQRPRKRLTELMLKSLNESLNNDSQEDVKSFKPIFYRSPRKFLVDDTRQLTGIELTCNVLQGDSIDKLMCVPKNDKEILDCSLAFRSIGYQSISLDKDLPLTPHGTIPNASGRVMINSADGLGDVYVAGWLGTGPTGVILHTMGNSFHVAKHICEDIKAKDIVCSKGGFEDIKKLLKHSEIVDWRGWEKLNEYEIEQGKKNGKPREKVCSIKKMLEIAIGS